MFSRLLLLLSLAMAGAFAQTEKPYQEWLNQGVQSFKSARYTEAVAAFEHAVALNPAAVEPHLYLGRALMTQWIPGLDSPKNTEVARAAQAGFEAVLRLDPRNLTALQSLASMTYSQAMPSRDPLERRRQLDEAAALYHRILEVDPQAKEAHYSLGVIAWSQFYPELMAARARLGMKPQDPGPLKDLNTRQDLRARFGGVVEQGIENLRDALALDPAYDDAMAYLNLLIRERGDLRDTAEEYKQDVKSADQWVQKALETKRLKGPDGTSNLQAAPPPPPPPAGSAQRIRVTGNVQEYKLVRKVDPEYPAQALEARIQGTVRFIATIGKDGQLQNLQLISGHPLLVRAAMDAVRQWVYQPTLLNGEPVEVVTSIDVPFLLKR